MQVFLDSGMVVFSLYFFHSEGASLRNKALFQKAMSIAASYGSPWIIAGDLNCVFEAILAQWADSLERANAYVVATKEATHCPPAGAHRIVDFAVCSHQVRDWIKNMYVDLGFEAAPRRAVRVRIQAEPANHLVRVIAGPRHIYKQQLIGYFRRPLFPTGIDSVAIPNSERRIIACARPCNGNGAPQKP